VEDYIKSEIILHPTSFLLFFSKNKVDVNNKVVVIDNDFTFRGFFIRTISDKNKKIN